MSKQLTLDVDAQPSTTLRSPPHPAAELERLRAIRRPKLQPKPPSIFEIFERLRREEEAKRRGQELDEEVLAVIKLAATLVGDAEP